MITRVATITETVAMLSEVLQTSCELISFLAAMWWDAGSSGCKHFWLSTCMAEWRVINPRTGRVSIREGEVTAEPEVAPDRVIVTGSALKTAEKRFGLKILIGS